jgi:hypothetical protein
MLNIDLIRPMSSSGFTPRYWQTFVPGHKNASAIRFTTIRKSFDPRLRYKIIRCICEGFQTLILAKAKTGLFSGRRQGILATLADAQTRLPNRLSCANVAEKGILPWTE